MSHQNLSDQVSINSRLDGLRQQWAQSRKQLYQILASCLEIVNDCAADTENRMALDNALQLQRIKVTKKMKPEAKVVSYIFNDNDDRKRRHTYARVLKTAVNEKIKPDAFVNWIEDEGGIEKIRLSWSGNCNQPPRKQLIIEAKSRLEMQDLTGSPFKLDAKFRCGAGYEQPLSVAIVRIDTHGNAQIAWARRTNSY